MGDFFLAVFEEDIGTKRTCSCNNFFWDRIWRGVDETVDLVFGVKGCVLGLYDARQII